MRFLISTVVHDIHAAAVALVLRQSGHDVFVHHGADYPARQTQSFRIASGRRCSLRVADAENEYEFASPDVVWARRRTSGKTPDSLHPADVPFANRESQHVSDAIWSLAAPDAFWINPQPAAVRARLKPVQLDAAQELGMDIPETLITNDPHEIRAFLREHDAVAYKPAMSANWTTERGVSSLYTRRVTQSDLPDDAALHMCPGIFQRFVPKSHELRVTVMGRSVFVLKLRSAELALAQDDWRRAQARGLQAEPAVLPFDVQEKCLALMERLGLVFGCIDLIVDPEGRHVFLEVNEMGQFLWAEHMCPQMPMLDAFAQFCESGRSDFVYRNQSGRRHAFAEWSAAAEAHLEVEAGVHRSPKIWHTADERRSVSEPADSMLAA